MRYQVIKHKTHGNFLIVDTEIRRETDWYKTIKEACEFYFEDDMGRSMDVREVIYEFDFLDDFKEEYPEEFI